MDAKLPLWTESLEPEDWQFLKRFLVASGSLKTLAEEYDISYPTVRSRLDRLIAKVHAADQADVTDSFHRQLRILVAEERMDLRLARKLLEAHRKVLKQHEIEKDPGGPSHGT